MKEREEGFLYPSNPSRFQTVEEIILLRRFKLEIEFVSRDPILLNLSYVAELPTAGSKELSLCQKLKFACPYIFSTWWCMLLIQQKS